MDAPGDYSLRIYNKETPRELIIMQLEVVREEGKGSLLCVLVSVTAFAISVYSVTLCVSDILSVTLCVLGV